MAYITSRELENIKDSQEKYCFLSRSIVVKKSRPSGNAGFEVETDIVTAVRCGHKIYLRTISPHQFVEDLLNLLRREKYEDIFIVFKRLFRERDYGKFLIKTSYVESLGNYSARSYVCDAILRMRHLDYFFFFNFMREISYHGVPLKLTAEGGMVNGTWYFSDVMDKDPKVLTEGYYSFRSNKLTKEDEEKIEAAAAPYIRGLIKEADNNMAQFKEKFIEELVVLN